MATPALDRAVLVRPGTSRDLDEVMEVMDAAFGDRFGEAWTRSQCAGILPMAGVSLMVSREGEGGAAVGFSLSRTVAEEAELLLLAVVPRHHRQGNGRILLDDFMQRARDVGVNSASILKFATATPPSRCISTQVSSLLEGALNITMPETAHASTH